MIKIATQIAYKYGVRNYGIMIPPVFKNDNKIKDKDQMDIYRTIIDGKDVLVIVPVKSNGKVNQLENRVVTEL